MTHHSVRGLYSFFIAFNVFLSSSVLGIWLLKTNLEGAFSDVEKVFLLVKLNLLHGVFVNGVVEQEHLVALRNQALHDGRCEDLLFVLSSQEVNACLAFLESF